jgi:predicted site-specific integrase-resolvase
MGDDVLLKRAELVQRLRINTGTLGRWMREKRIPPPDIATTRKNQQWKVSTLRAAGLNV